MAGIFISYRREDSAAYAGRLYDRMCLKFGKERTFIDVDTIKPGDDFVEAIEKRVAVCDVLIALIGKNWLTSKDEDGKRRLDNPDDFVHAEVAAALKREIRIIPILVDGARMPRRQDLPEPLGKLVRRNALELSHVRFEQDVQVLFQGLQDILTGAGKARSEAQEAQREESKEGQRMAAEELERATARKTEEAAAETAARASANKDPAQKRIVKVRVEKNAGPTDKVLALLRSKFGGIKRVHLDPNIPGAMLATIREVYKAHLTEAHERILLVYDDTALGGAKDGFIVTASGVGCRASPFNKAEYWAVSAFDWQAFHAVMGCVAIDHDAKAAFLRDLPGVLREAGAMGCWLAPVSTREEDILSVLRAAFSGSPDTYIDPDIPLAKLTTAQAVYHPLLKSEDYQRILLLYDDTVLGGAKDGFIITASGVGCKAMGADPKYWRHASVDKAALAETTKCVNGVNKQVAKRLSRVLKRLKSWGEQQHRP